MKAMKVKEFHLLFEQSGTFKRELNKLGYAAYDYDILDDFGQTNYRVDLFHEIEKAYDGCPNMFDTISKRRGGIIAFFPCIRFSVQFGLAIRTDSQQMRKYDDLKRLETTMRYEAERSYLYQLICKMCIVCLRKGIPLVIENPYATQHYLSMYFPIRAKVIINDRSERGDYYRKPTQFFFIGCKPEDNLIMDEGYWRPEKKRRVIYEGKVDRSIISPHFARWFLRTYIIGENDEESAGMAKGDNLREAHDQA